MEESNKQGARNKEHRFHADPEAETKVRWPHPQEAGDKERYSPNAERGSALRNAEVEKAVNKRRKDKSILTPRRDQGRTDSWGKGWDPLENGRKVSHQDRPQTPSISPPATREGCMEWTSGPWTSR